MRPSIVDTFSPTEKICTKDEKQLTEIFFKKAPSEEEKKLHLADKESIKMSTMQWPFKGSRLLTNKILFSNPDSIRMHLRDQKVLLLWPMKRRPRNIFRESRTKVQAKQKLIYYSRRIVPGTEIIGLKEA